MKRNLDPNNKIPFVYDLDEDEIDSFYRGAGEATIVVDVALKIQACVYDDLSPRDGEQPAFVEAVARPGTRWMEGTMSCHQFCAFDEGRISR